MQDLTPRRSDDALCVHGASLDPACPPYSQGTFLKRRARSDALLVCASEILQGPGYAPGVAHYLFNFVKGDEAKGPALAEQAAGFLRVRMWGIDADEPHRNALAPGDLILIYLGAPEHGSTRAIPLAECCWLRSRNGTRPYR
jgi:hypothetical protein